MDSDQVPSPPPAPIPPPSRSESAATFAGTVAPPPRPTAGARAQFRHRRSRAAAPRLQRRSALNAAEMDELYQLLTHNVAQVDEAHGELILARLALLLMQEVGDAQRVEALIAQASRLTE